MPLLYIKEIAQDVKIGLWRITKDDEMVGSSDDNESLKQRLSDVKSQKRRAEIIAVDRLLRSILQAKTLILNHKASGQPVIEGYNVSISHTRGYAAAILSPTKNVAIDIEYRSERVNKIVEKFLRNDEMAATTELRLLHWCAKECLYKLLPDEQLQFDEMRVGSISAIDKATFEIENLRSARRYEVHQASETDFVLTYIY